MFSCVEHKSYSWNDFLLFFSYGFGLTDYNIILRICSNIINTLMWAIGMFTAW